MSVVAELKTILSADLRQLEADLKAADQKTRAAGAKIQANLNKPDASKAIGNVLGDVKGKAMAGGEALGVFGGALEALGPMGVAAAVGVGALAFAANKAREAMDWADELDKQASMLGVTTTQLQKFDYAAEAMSVGLKEGREALSTFSGLMGGFEAATGDKKVAKFADAIKLTREEVRAATDPVSKLQIVMEKLAELPNSGERKKFATAFGLDALLPVLQDGKEGVAEFTAKMREAQAAGGVISEESIKQAAEMNDEVDRLTLLIDMHFRQAFIDLAPTIEAVAGFIEQCVHNLTDFIGQIPLAVRGIGDLLSGIGDVANKLHITDAIRFAAGAAANNPNAMTGPLPTGAMGQVWDQMIQRGKVAKLKSGIADLMAGGKVDAPADFLQMQKQGKGVSLAPTGGGGGAAAAKALEQARRAANESLSAEKESLGFKIAELQAQREITDGATARADIEDQLAVLADQQKAIDLKKQDSDAHFDRLAKKITPAMEAEVQAHTEAARLSAEKVAELQKQARTAKRGAALEDETHAENMAALDLAQEMGSYETDLLSSKSAMATTAAERADLEIQALRDQQNVEREIYKERLRHLVELKRLNPADPNGLTQDQADSLQRVFDASQAGRLDQARFNAAGPLEQYKRSLLDIDTALENVKANGLASFNEGIAQAALHFESLGSVAKGVISGIAQDLVRLAVQRYITAPLANALFPETNRKPGKIEVGAIASLLGGIPRFATGTNSAPKGLALVGDGGPEIVQLGGGERIYSNADVRRMSVGDVSARPAPAVNHFTTVVHADGSVMVDSIKGWIIQGNAMAVSAARKQTVEDLNRSNRQNLIRR